MKIILIINNSEGKTKEEKLEKEGVLLQNQTLKSIDIINWVISDYNPITKKLIHRNKLNSDLTKQISLNILPNEYVFISTGKGTYKYTSNPSSMSNPVHFIYLNYEWFIWNNDGDTADLFDSNSNLIDSKTI